MPSSSPARTASYAVAATAAAQAAITGRRWPQDEPIDHRACIALSGIEASDRSTELPG